MTMPKTAATSNFILPPKDVDIIGLFNMSIREELKGAHVIRPYRFPVMLLKEGTTVPVIGYVVTHLSLDEWCEMKGYKLMDQYPGHRVAFPDERTDLF
jgi:hypothetical protein